VILGLLAALLAPACTQATPETSAFATITASEVPPTPATVPVALYFRDEGEEAALLRVKREIAPTGEPARAALELLIAGPTGGEGLPVLPADITVEEFSVADEEARIVVDGDLGSSSSAASDGPRSGLLGLAAIANTLTEFPSISSVVLDSDDDSGAVFAGWGRPDKLVRDESFIAPLGENDPISAMETFTTAPQAVGSADVSPSTVAGVRVLDRLTHVRLIVELADVDSESGGGSTIVGAPRAEALAAGDHIALRIGGLDLSAGVPAVVEGPGGAIEEVALRAAVEDDELALQIRSGGGRVHPFHLLTDVSPTRILLDVKK
jgi:hypothetical protein